MAPKYKLTYFNGPGRAEPLRYIFAYAGQEFEDARLKGEDWPKIKPTTPFGKVPVLEIDGKPVSQSNAIARYLAKKFGLLGADEWTALKADEIVEAFNDYHAVSMKLMFGEENPTNLENLKKEKASYLSKFDQLVSENKSGLLVGSEVTWADLTFAASLSSGPNYQETLKPYPALSALVEKINNLPAIKEYLQKRPKFDPPPFPKKKP